MKYRPDPHLEFLQFCSQDDLEAFVDVMTRKNGKLRTKQTLKRSRVYQRSRWELPKVWDTLAAYLQAQGADSIATKIRGGAGVVYQEIVGDVAGKLRVDLKGAKDIGEKEGRILAKLFEKSFEKMSEDERVAFTKEFLDKGGKGTFDFARATPAAMKAATETILGKGGAASYQMAEIVANAVLVAATGKGLQMAANFALTRWLAAFAGPIGVAVAAILGVLMVSGPAYSVTIPAVVHVAYLRLKLANEALL
jgi:uncharacterized protein YaaW (UPF0174 family)